MRERAQRASKVGVFGDEGGTLCGGGGLELFRSWLGWRWSTR